MEEETRVMLVMEEPTWKRIEGMALGGTEE
jgi:hypothetical protein